MRGNGERGGAYSGSKRRKKARVLGGGVGGGGGGVGGGGFVREGGGGGSRAESTKGDGQAAVGQKVGGVRAAARIRVVPCGCRDAQKQQTHDAAAQPPRRAPRARRTRAA
ncbi:hypothetical protein FGB62_14g255 [Gracilaria domingensis]|nr:hypothetical protein FGB62_14g255 [Gracilaria domingensis]